MVMVPEVEPEDACTFIVSADCQPTQHDEDRHKRIREMIGAIDILEPEV